MLDDNLLAAFMRDFYGYGNLAAPLWFVGMEEGGGGRVEEIEARLQAWHERGRKQVEDVADYHVHFGISHLFLPPKPPIQMTWGKLIRATLAGNGRAVSNEDIRAYQAKGWGRTGGTTCLLELLPLPSPGTGRWLYGQHSKIDFLRTRETYRNEVSMNRVETIRELTKKFQPRAIVFYGKGYQEYWEQISGKDVSWRPWGEGFRANSAGTAFFSMPHPTSRGVTNKLFDDLGAELRRTLA